MKVRILGLEFDANEVPFLLIFEPGERELIERMEPAATMFAIYPDDHFEDEEAVRAWMAEPGLEPRVHNIEVPPALLQSWLKPEYSEPPLEDGQALLMIVTNKEETVDSTPH